MHHSEKSRILLHKCLIDQSIVEMGKNNYAEERKIALDYKSLGFTTSKTKLAKLIKVHRSSIYRYIQIAETLSDDYIAESDKHYNHLTRYQCWVIWNISVIFAECGSDGSAAMAKIAEIIDQLTISRFEWIQRQQPNHKHQPLNGIA